MNGIAVAATVQTPIGMVYIAPNGTAMAMWRIGERRDGRLVVTVDLSDDEIERAGLTGRVNPFNHERNR